MERDELTADVREALERSLDLTRGLAPEQWVGPYLRIVNPLHWEIGHVTWFLEKWVLRQAAGRPPLRADADSLYDSMAIEHSRRWRLPLPSPDETLDYLRSVVAGVAALLESSAVTEELAYFCRLGVFHQDMHHEAFTYTRQTLGYPAPRFGHVPEPQPVEAGPWPGDVEVPGGVWRLGAESPGEPFVFDNEKWAHPVEVAPFHIARAPVTQAEFAAFVDDGGYRRPELWTPEGRRWREEAGAEHPVYWRRSGGAWERRDFDRWVPLEPHRPVLHVNAHEAEAYCAWAGRRLPTEAEWEMAASWDPATGRKLRFPWGDVPPTPEGANLDWRHGGAVDVAAFPEGDSPCGCRQMIGNVWEWTSDPFLPYPGFTPDPYKEYSEPWFGDHRVLRGGCWATRSRLIRNTWRNFYQPHRQDVWAGFRTCAR